MDCENLADLYGSVLFFDGPPTRTQVSRASSLGRELRDVSLRFDTWMARELPGINAALVARKFAPVGVPVP